MTQQYLVGELSILVDQLTRVARDSLEAALRDLRHRVECNGVGALSTLASEAITDADHLCWSSLDRGDLEAVAGQAAVAVALDEFAALAHLCS